MPKARKKQTEGRPSIETAGVRGANKADQPDDNEDIVVRLEPMALLPVQERRPVRQHDQEHATMQCDGNHTTMRHEDNELTTRMHEIAPGETGMIIPATPEDSNTTTTESELNKSSFMTEDAPPGADNDTTLCTTTQPEDFVMDHHTTNPKTTTSTSTAVSTITLAKSTTCAFTPAATTGPHNHNHNAPIDDTMANAVGTLTIGQTNHPTVPPTATRPWTLVHTTQKKASTGAYSSGQEFGLAFERTTKGNNWSTDDLLLILQTIQAHDPKAMLSSADNKTKPTLVTAILHKAQKDIPWFTKFTAMKTMTWASPLMAQPR